MPTKCKSPSPSVVMPCSVAWLSGRREWAEGRRLHEGTAIWATPHGPIHLRGATWIGRFRGAGRALDAEGLLPALKGSRKPGCAFWTRFGGITTGCLTPEKLPGGRRRDCLWGAEISLSFLTLLISISKLDTVTYPASVTVKRFVLLFFFCLFFTNVL